MKRIVIIGGGAAGLAAAVSAGRAAKGKGIQVTLLEANPRVGKKLLATGNGRCNISNRDISARFYHGGHMEMVAKILEGSAETVAAFFESMGIIFTEEDGRLYPYSRLATSVLDMLRAEAEAAGVKTVTDNKVSCPDFVRLLETSKVILATGGLAAPHTGATGDGLDFLARVGHGIAPTFPALTPLNVRHPALPSLKGIRVRPCGLTLNGAYSVGEVQFTQNGLSGIPAMNISGAFKKPATVHIDLFPAMIRREIRVTKHFYAAFFHKNLAAALIKDNADVKDWPMRVTGVSGYASAQVTGGGAVLSRFDPRTMASLVQKNLFAAGELLDVYGDCGGYNLHWAWVTGILAGKGAVESIEKGL